MSFAQTNSLRPLLVVAATMGYLLPLSANGQYNMAHRATLTSDSQLGTGSWGREENAVDGEVVPEPASTSLLALGSITLLLRRRR